MIKLNFLNKIKQIYTSSKFLNIVSFILFSIFLTFLLASKYFLFQSLISHDKTSTREIVATKKIEVVDTFKTEQLKKEVSARIDPILVPAEDTYIKNNLASIANTIKKIREDKSLTNQEKHSQLEIIFDISDDSAKRYIINYFLSAQQNTVDTIFLKANIVLDTILKEGISEKDFEKGKINTVIFQHLQQNISKSEIRVISNLLEQVIMPNMIVDENATELAKKNAMNSVAPYVVSFEKGDTIVFAGEPVTKVKRDALSKAGYNVLEINYKGILGIFVLVTIGMLSIVYYLKFFDNSFLSKNYISIILLLVSIVSFIGIILTDDLSEYLVPIPAFAMLLSIFTNARVASFISAITSVVLGVSLQFPTQVVAVFVLISFLSSIFASQIRYSRRFDLIRAGLEISLAMFALICAAYLIEVCVVDIWFHKVITDIVSGVFIAAFSGIIVLGSIPILESAFQIITPFGLAELADHNQPLLKRLQFEAPGTFSHSLAVSNLCESAAQAIGANPVLARVGAFYHDIGKLKRPLFFVENQTYFGIENPHTKLNPRLSKMVIMAHPKDGIDLAKEYHLPSQIQNFIIQHHGETMASYFYNQAVLQEGEENVSKDQFRYSGPKPNTKETAILMIADAVESASRTLKDYSQEEIDNMIKKIINDRLNDDQLSDSPLTLKDLKTISSTLNRILRAAHHQRIKYHDDIIEELEYKQKNTLNE